MTNGEMIQKVFNCEVCEPIIEDDIIHVIFADKKESAIGFDWSWWNAEYKEPTTKNDLSADCVSRNAPKQVELEGDGYAYGTDEIVYDFGKCPTCGWEFEDGDKDWEEPYCCHCGQKLEWFDDETERNDEK